MQENKKNLQNTLEELLDITEKGLDKETKIFNRNSLAMLLAIITSYENEEDRSWLVNSWKEIVTEKYDVKV